MSVLDTRAIARALGVPPAEDEAAARQEIGRRWGPYVLDDLVGVGGTGAVYRARRVDGVAGPVAVKLVRGAGAARRLRREAACVRRLDHPAIVRLLDAGEGYLVFEFVLGRPIDVYCDERALPLSRRLELFHMTCEAIEHAHRRGVIHRDLKPAHVLVTEDGRPRIVDFGIACAETGDAASRTLLAAMTPLYASPEQLRGGRPTAASDVFALGVLLHDLVASERPRASSDLGRILARAMEPDPARRYASARALARDVARYREGKRVRARGRASWRGPAVAALAIAAAGAGAFVASRAAPPRASEPAPAAASPAARLVADALFAADPSRRGGDRSAVTLLADVGLRIDSEVTPREPQEAAALHELVGRTFLGLRLPWPAEFHFDRALRIRRERGEGNEAIVPALEGLGLAQALADRAEGLPLRRAALEARLAAGDEVASARSRIGLAVALVRSAAPPRCDEAARELDAAVAKLGGADPAATLEALAWRAEVERYRGDAARAEALAGEALAFARLGLGDENPFAIDALVTRARSLAELGRRKEAEGAFRRALDLTRKRIGEVAAAGRLTDLALLAAAAGDLGAAERLLLDALAIRAASYASREKAASRLLESIRERLASHDPAVARPAVLESLDVVGRLRGDPPFDTFGWQETLTALGSVIEFAGDAAAAERLFRAAIVARERLFPSDHWRLAEGRCRIAAERDAALASLLRALGEAHPAVRAAIAAHR